MQKANNLLILNVIIMRSKEVTAGQNYHIQLDLEIRTWTLDARSIGGRNWMRLAMDRDEWKRLIGPTTGCRAIYDDDFSTLLSSAPVMRSHARVFVIHISSLIPALCRTEVEK